MLWSFWQKWVCPMYTLHVTLLECDVNFDHAWQCRSHLLKVIPVCSFSKTITTVTTFWYLRWKKVVLLKQALSVRSNDETDEVIYPQSLRFSKQKSLRLTVLGWWALWSSLGRWCGSSSPPHTSPWSRSCGPSPWETPAPPPPRQSTGFPCAPGSAGPSPVGPSQDNRGSGEMKFWENHDFSSFSNLFSFYLLLCFAVLNFLDWCISCLILNWISSPLKLHVKDSSFMPWKKFYFIY